MENSNDTNERNVFLEIINLNLDRMRSDDRVRASTEAAYISRADIIL